MRLLVDKGVGERDRIISSTFPELELMVDQVVAASLPRQRSGSKSFNTSGEVAIALEFAERSSEGFSGMLLIKG